MTARRLCLLIASLSVCAMAHAELQNGTITPPIATELNMGALTVTLTGLTALGMYLSFRRPLLATRKPGTTNQA